MIEIDNDNVTEEYKKPLRQLFVELCGLNSVMNEEPAELYFHVFMGAKLKKTFISDGISNKDLRVSFTFIQTSRTGKGRLNKAMKRICEECGIKICIMTDFSTAGVIGTVDDEAIKQNEKYREDGLTEENPEIKITDKKGTEKIIKWQNPIVRGDAGNYDIMIFDELKKLLEPSRENEQLMLDLLPALDCPPYIRKKLRSKYPIEYSHPISIIGTTVPIISIGKIMATSGFMQRTFIYMRKMNFDEIREMRVKQQDLLDPSKKELFKKKLKIFKEKVDKIQDVDRLLTIDESGKKELLKVNEEFLKIISNLKGANRETVLSFTNTVEETALKIAGQYVAMYNKDVIRDVDIRRSYTLVRKFMDILVSRLNIREEKTEQEEIDKVINIFKRHCKSTEKNALTQAEFKQVLNKALNRGIMSCASLITELTEAGYFKLEKGDKNTYLYRLSED